MSGNIESVVVIGLGKVGSLVAGLLDEHGMSVTAADRQKPRRPPPVRLVAVDIVDDAGLRALLGGNDAVVSCLPYEANVRVATAAHELGLHYFDLTEDVASSAQVARLAATATTAFAPQCGLAPGFIGIVGAALAADFDAVERIELRVGALPRNPSGLLGYAFNWSPEGVVNEYLNDCEVIRAGRRMIVPAMGAIEKVVIGGTNLEAFTTSGGLGTMCETFEGRVRSLDYKTLRYPGHWELMRFFFDELGMRDRRREAGEILVKAKPPVDEDIVYVHAAVVGQRRGENRRDEFVREYLPRDLIGGRWRAISWTTASSVAAVVELVSTGVLPSRGLVKQELIPLDAFLATPAGGNFGARHRLEG